MSPIVEKAGRFYLNETEKTGLYLTWLSCNDFGALRKIENQVLLKKAWANIKGRLPHYFKNHVISLDSIVKTFKKINLTINPKIDCAYDPEKDMLIYNLWSLFFSSTNDEFATPKPPWQIAGLLIHEYDHYLFFRKSAMIGKTEKEYEEFNREHLNELEKRAYSNQIAFLEKCKKKVPSKALTYKIRIRKWSPDGKPIDHEIPVIPMAKKGIINQINQVILQYRNVLRKIEVGKGYDDFSREDSMKSHLKIIDLLSLPIKLDPSKDNYPRIEITM